MGIAIPGTVRTARLACWKRAGACPPDLHFVLVDLRGGHVHVFVTRNLSQHSRGVGLQLGGHGGYEPTKTDERRLMKGARIGRKLGAQKEHPSNCRPEGAVFNPTSHERSMNNLRQLSSAEWYIPQVEVGVKEDHRQLFPGGVGVHPATYGGSRAEEGWRLTGRSRSVKR